MLYQMLHPGIVRYRAGEDPEVAVRALGKSLIHVHVRDCVGREQRVGPPPDQVPGRGNVDLVAFVQALERGVNGAQNVFGPSEQVRVHLGVLARPRQIEAVSGLR